MKIFSQLKSAFFEILASTPGFLASEKARIVFDDSTKTAKINNGTAWQSIGESAVNDGIRGGGLFKYNFTQAILEVDTPPPISAGGEYLAYNHTGRLFAQSFTLSAADTIESIDIWLSDLNLTEPVGTGRIDIYDDNAGDPGTLLATGTNKNLSGVNSHPHILQRFLVSYAASAATKYWFVYSINATAGGTQIAMASTDIYPGHEAKLYVPSTWYVLNKDIYFNVNGVSAKRLLQFTGDISVQISGLSDSDNTIPFTASPLDMTTTGDYAYVVPNQSSGGPNLTVSIGAANTVPSNAVIVARNIANYLHVGPLKLADQEELSLDTVFASPTTAGVVTATPGFSVPTLVPDYEEGIWTPTIGIVSGVTGTPNAGGDGRWVRMGNVVFVSIPLVGGLTLQTVGYVALTINHSGTDLPYWTSNKRIAGFSGAFYSNEAGNPMAATAGRYLGSTQIAFGFDSSNMTVGNILDGREFAWFYYVNQDF